MIQRLEFKGIILKPVQIIEEVLIDLTYDDSVDAIIQGRLIVFCVQVCQFYVPYLEELLFVVYS